jgi:hypothetical protein
VDCPPLFVRTAGQLGQRLVDLLRGAHQYGIEFDVAQVLAYLTLEAFPIVTVAGFVDESLVGEQLLDDRPDPGAARRAELSGGVAQRGKVYVPQPTTRPRVGVVGDRTAAGCPAHPTAGLRHAGGFIGQRVACLRLVDTRGRDESVAIWSEFDRRTAQRHPQCEARVIAGTAHVITVGPQRASAIERLGEHA